MLVINADIARIWSSWCRIPRNVVVLNFDVHTSRSICYSVGTSIDIPLVLAGASRVVIPPGRRTCFCGKLMFDIVQCDIVHDVGTFAGRATNTQHGQSHKVIIQVRYIKVLAFVSMLFSSMLRSAQKASCRAKISNWWLVVVWCFLAACRIWWNYAEMHCSKYVLLLVDPAFQTFSLFTWVGREGCGW